MSLNNSYIHFVKTNAITFASRFKAFDSWLHSFNSLTSSYINVEGDIENGLTLDSSDNVILKSGRKPYPIITGDRGSGNVFFLDDIKVIYFNGIPYDSGDDYINSAQIDENNTIKDIYTEGHTLHIPTGAIIPHLPVIEGPKGDQGEQGIQGMQGQAIFETANSLYLQGISGVYDPYNGSEPVYFNNIYTAGSLYYNGIYYDASAFALAEDADTLHIEVNTLIEDVSVLKADVSILYEDVSILQDDVSILKDRVEDLSTNIDDISTDVSALKNELNDLSTNINERLDDLAEEIEASEQNIDDKLQEVYQYIDVSVIGDPSNAYDRNSLTLYGVDNRITDTTNDIMSYITWRNAED